MSWVSARNRRIYTFCPAVSLQRHPRCPAREWMRANCPERIRCHRRTEQRGAGRRQGTPRSVAAPREQRCASANAHKRRTAICARRGYAHSRYAARCECICCADSRSQRSSSELSEIEIRYQHENEMIGKKSECEVSINFGIYKLMSFLINPYKNGQFVYICIDNIYAIKVKFRWIDGIRKRTLFSDKVNYLDA